MMPSTITDRGTGRRGGLLGSSALTPRCGFLAVAVLGCAALLAPPASANPQGGVVVGGEAAIRSEPGRTTIDQASDKAIIDWASFGIAPGETTRFNQPGRDSVALNRVTGGAASDIAGTLQANGNVWLVNPNGVLIRHGARVDVNGLLATTADIDNADFLAGRFDFDRPSPKPDATVVNEGEITVGERGLAALVAPGVANSGTIAGQLGQVVLAGAPTFTIDFAGDGLINFDLTSEVTGAPAGAAALVRNDGRIIAPGGSVTLTARAAAGIVDRVINMGGVIEARAVRQEGGTIILAGGEEGRVTVAGTLDASGNSAGQTGGRIEVLGDEIALADGARLDASGDAGGGTVLVGGDRQGQGPLPTASRTLVAEDARIAADAGGRGDGGTVIVWADEATGFAGKVSARGGATGGDGGFVETSGKESLQVAASAEVDTRAPAGQTGQWLLDPTDIDVVDSGDSPDTSNLGEVDEFFDADASSAGTRLDVAAINGATSDVTLQAEGSIDFEAAVTLPCGAGNCPGLTALAGNEIDVFEDMSVGGALVLQAAEDIRILAAVSASSIYLNADSLDLAPQTFLAGDGNGTLFLDDGAALSSNGGPITLIGASIDRGFDGIGTVDAGGGDIFVASSRDGDPFFIGGEAPTIASVILANFSTSGTVTLGEAVPVDSLPDGSGPPTPDRLTARSIDIEEPAEADVGALRLVSDGEIDQDSGSAITTDDLVLVAGGAITLNALNHVGTLAVAAPGQSVTFDDADGLTIGMVAGTSGVEAGSAAIVAGGPMTIAAPVVTTGGPTVLAAQGSGSSLFVDSLVSGGPGDVDLGGGQDVIFGPGGSVVSEGGTVIVSAGTSESGTGRVEFGGALDGDFELIVDAPESIRFRGDVGQAPSSDLPDGSALRAVLLTTSGDVAIDGRFHAQSLTLAIGGAFENRNLGPSAGAGEGLVLGSFTIVQADAVTAFGAVDGQTGAAAALEPSVPAVDPDYTLNGCVIGSTEPCVTDTVDPLGKTLPRVEEIGSALTGGLRLDLNPPPLLVSVPVQPMAGGERSLYANDGNEELW